MSHAMRLTYPRADHEGALTRMTSTSAIVTYTEPTEATSHSVVSTRANSGMAARTKTYAPRNQSNWMLIPAIGS